MPELKRIGRLGFGSSKVGGLGLGVEGEGWKPKPPSIGFRVNTGLKL